MSHLVTLESYTFGVLFSLRVTLCAVMSTGSILISTFLHHPTLLRKIWQILGSLLIRFWSTLLRDAVFLKLIFKPSFLHSFKGNLDRFEKQQRQCVSSCSGRRSGEKIHHLRLPSKKSNDKSLFVLIKLAIYEFVLLFS